jgi:hypothetical protein
VEPSSLKDDLDQLPVKIAPVFFVRVRETALDPYYLTPSKKAHPLQGIGRCQPINILDELART